MTKKKKRPRCNWCDYPLQKRHGQRKYCNECAKYCAKECNQCHRPFPSLDLFDYDNEKCNACFSKNCKAKAKRKQNKKPCCQCGKLVLINNSVTINKRLFCTRCSLRYEFKKCERCGDKEGFYKKDEIGMCSKCKSNHIIKKCKECIKVFFEKV